ncbi:MAG: hypothetical protein IJ179_03200 [Oscillospiraceae bacterium]|nr:hypothetical protein [Oscillospiraceae bacterium]
MNRWKKLLALLLAAAMLLALSGCGVFDTKMAKALQKMSKLRNLHYEISADLSLDIRQAESEESGQNADAEPAPGITVDGSFRGSGELFVDPLLVKMDTKVSVPGFESSKRLYLEKKDSVFFVYSLANSGTIWEKQGFALGEKARVSALRFLITGLESFEITDDPALQQEGATCFRGVLGGEFLQELLEMFEVESTLTEGLGLRLAEGLFGEITDVPAYLWLDNSTGMISRVDVDLTETGANLARLQLAELREASAFDSLGLETELTELRLSVQLSQFDEAESFTIPDEAQAPWGETVMPWEK